MKNLIMADLKILGSRVWRIPLGFAAGSFVLSLLTGFSDTDYTSLVYFINLFLVPVLMLYELLREEQKNKSEMMILTMPVNKSRFVYSKFMITVFFILLGIFSLMVSLITQNLINGSPISQLYSNLTGLYFYFCVLSFVALFCISFYYYTSKLYFSLFSATGGLLIVLFLLAWTSEKILLPINSSWLHDFDLFLYPLRLIYVMVGTLIINYLMKISFKKIPEKFYLNGWFFVISTVTAMYALNLFKIIFFEYKVISDAGLKTVIKNGIMTHEQVNWANAIEKFYPHLISYLITTVILIILWVILFYKNKDRIFTYFSLISLIPFIAMSLPEIIYLYFRSFLQIKIQYYGDDPYFIATISQIVFIPFCFIVFAKLTVLILNSKTSY